MDYFRAIVIPSLLFDLRLRWAEWFGGYPC